MLACPLDQSMWLESRYTAPTKNALIFDLMLIRDDGFSSVRKHVKVEPAQRFHNADKFGLLVWQVSHHMHVALL